MPEVEHTEDSVHSLVDVDSPHISSVPSDFESQSVKTDTQAERIKQEQELRGAAKEAEAKAKQAKEKAAAKAKRGGYFAKENSDNPVVLGNALTLGILTTVLGVGAYRKYVRDELTWKVAGAWAGVVGLFAVGDYYVSQYDYSIPKVWLLFADCFF
jgi:cation transport ATPase